MKVVVDANVLLSGLISPQGVPGRIVAAWLDQRFDVVGFFFTLTPVFGLRAKQIG